MPPRDSLQLFLEQLRAQQSELPSAGLGRWARTVRGGLGMAATAWSARRRSGSFDASDLRRWEQTVARLGQLKGLPMKAGQILSYLEADLPDELRRLLAVLQTQSQPTAFARVEQVVREDLGDAADLLLARLDRTPVSVASIGQVHRGTLPDGAAVAVKVRHPDIEEAIRSDFRGAAAGTGLASLVLPAVGATAREVVAEAEARLLEECDYRLEAEHQQTYGKLFAGHADVVVPLVHPAWSGRRVLTTSWEEGEPFETFASQAPQEARDRAGRALFEVYVATLYRHSLFHADPHPGNYSFRTDGRVVVFDYGCVRRFDAEAVRGFVELAESVRLHPAPAGDGPSAGDEAMRAALTRLGARPPSAPDAFAHVRRLMHGFFAPMLQPGKRRIDGRIRVDFAQIQRDKLAVAKMRLPGKLLFLFRIRFGLYSVLSRLGSEADWSALEQGFAEEARRSGVLSP